MAFKFVLFLATLAFANAGLIAQEPQYYSAHQDHHYQPAVHAYAAPAATSYSKQTSYSAPKTVIAQPQLAYSHQPQLAYAQPQLAYAHQPQIAYAQPLAKTVSTYTSAPAISHGHYGYEHGQSEQNIVRSAHGTVAHHSKSVITPHSSVSKYDTRITNDYASPSYAYSQPALKTVAYAAPAIQQYAAPALHSYSHAPAVQHYSAPAIQQYAAPALHSYSHAPAVHHTSVVAAPALHSYSAPAIQHYSAPAIHHAAPVHSYAPAVHQYAHASPVLAAKTISYSPSVAVSHTSFEGPNAHYAW